MGPKQRTNIYSEAFLLGGPFFCIIICKFTPINLFEMALREKI